MGERGKELLDLSSSESDSHRQHSSDDEFFSDGTQDSSANGDCSEERCYENPPECNVDLQVRTAASVHGFTAEEGAERRHDHEALEQWQALPTCRAAV